MDGQSIKILIMTVKYAKIKKFVGLSSVTQL